MSADSNGRVRVTYTLTVENKARLEAACVERSEAEGVYCPPARLVNELIQEKYHDLPLVAKKTPAKKRKPRR